MSRFERVQKKIFFFEKAILVHSATKSKKKKKKKKKMHSQFTVKILSYFGILKQFFFVVYASSSVKYC